MTKSISVLTGLPPRFSHSLSKYLPVINSEPVTVSAGEKEKMKQNPGPCPQRGRPHPALLTLSRADR